MTSPDPGAQVPTPTAGDLGGPPSTWQQVRRPLPVWVNVVLVLTLFGACGGANQVADFRPVDSESVATEVAERLRNETGGSGPATRDDIAQLCRLLAAVAADQGVNTSRVLGEDLGTACDEGARGTP